MGTMGPRTIIALLLAAFFQAQTAQTVSLSWNVTAWTDPAVSVHVYRTITGQGKWQLIATVPIATTTYTDTPPATGSYNYRIVEVDAAGDESLPTPTLTFVIVPRPGTPTNFTGKINPTPGG